MGDKETSLCFILRSCGMVPDNRLNECIESVVHDSDDALADELLSKEYLTASELKSAYELQHELRNPDKSAEAERKILFIRMKSVRRFAAKVLEQSCDIARKKGSNEFVSITPLLSDNTKP